MITVLRAGINLFDPAKIIYFLWLFLLVFPKGGFKLGNIPITWGYMLLGAVAFFLLFRKSWKIQIPRYSSLFCILPFQIVSLYTLVYNGFLDRGMAVSFFVTFFFLPICFFAIFSNDIETLDLERFRKLFVKGILFIASYGIFLFFVKQISGRFIEIPFLTTNWSDFGNLESKCVNRGTVFKLISTYNNGNIFGICILMLLPLYCFLENTFWKKTLVKIALILTLSRTVWIGLLFHEICYQIFFSKNKKMLVLKLLFSLGLFALFFAILAFLFGFSFDFFFDTDLGGRKDQFDVFTEMQLLSDIPFSSLFEIVYLSILYFFGLAGLGTFLIAMIGPVVIRLAKGYLSTAHKAVLLGIVNYLFISCSDGAILYLPTMAFYWFLISLFARKNLCFETDEQKLNYFRSDVPQQRVLR